MVIINGWRKEVDRINVDEYLHTSYFRYHVQKIFGSQGVTKVEIYGLPDVEKYQVVFWDSNNVVWTQAFKEYSKARTFAIRWMRVHPNGEGRWT